MNERTDGKLINTERVNELTRNIDLLPTEDIVRLINRLDREVPAKVGEQAGAIAKAVDLVVARFSAGGRLVYVGAGTSGRIGFMDAAECPPTYGVPADLFTCVMAGGRPAVFTPSEGAEDDEAQAVEDLREFGLSTQDAVMALSSSGRTPYCIGALKYAARIGAGRISLSCNPDAELSRLVEVAIEVDTGAEVISGSTRMKAGTCQKLVLNTISTAAMIRMGHVYGNLMIDTRGVNAKLGGRVLRIFAEATGNPDRARAEALLRETGGDVKTAVVMELADMTLEQAREALEKSGGFVRGALGQ